MNVLQEMNKYRSFSVGLPLEIQTSIHLNSAIHSQRNLKSANSLTDLSSRVVFDVQEDISDTVALDTNSFCVRVSHQNTLKSFIPSSVIVLS